MGNINKSDLGDSDLQFCSTIIGMWNEKVVKNSGVHQFEEIFAQGGV